MLMVLGFWYNHSPAPYIWVYKFGVHGLRRVYNRRMIRESTISAVDPKWNLTVEDRTEDEMETAILKGAAPGS